MASIIKILALLLLMLSVSWADEGNPLPDRKAKDSYSLGFEFGSNLKAQEVELDREVLFSAIREALDGKQPAIKIEEIRDNLKQLRKQVLIRYNLRRNEAAAKNRKDGEAYLAANKNREGVKSLASGLQYMVLKEGNGPTPQATDSARVNYRGTLVDGTEFDNTYKGGGPETVKVSGAIKGWAEALQLMKTGSKWRLFIPAGLAYGERQAGRIPPNSALIYELELIGIENPDKENNATLDELETTGDSSTGKL